MDRERAKNPQWYKGNDGGYAVSDFRKVRPDLGTMENLECLAEECHKRDVSICLDFVMNHTSEDHERKPLKRL